MRVGLVAGVSSLALLPCQQRRKRWQHQLHDLEHARLGPWARQAGMGVTATCIISRINLRI